MTREHVGWVLYVAGAIMTAGSVSYIYAYVPSWGPSDVLTAVWPWLPGLLVSMVGDHLIPPEDS